MAREGDLERVVGAIGALTREFAASGRRPFSDYKLGRSHFDILFALSKSESGMSVGALAERLAVTSGAISQLLDGLRAGSLITSETDATDARRRVVRLSGESRAEVDAFQRSYLEDLAPRFDALSNTEVATLARLLDLLDRGDRGASS